jgi:hypothetical protein
MSYVQSQVCPPAFIGPNRITEPCSHSDTRAHLPPPLHRGHLDGRLAGDVEPPAYNPYLAQTRPNALVAPYDMPIGMVNRALYLRRPRTFSRTLPDNRQE